MGIGRSSREHLTTGSGAAIDALLGFRRSPRSGSGFVVALSGSGQPFGVGADCGVVPGGSCPPEFPTFWILSALFGLETENGGARVLLGPAIANSESSQVGAAQARLELAQQIFSGFSLLASARLTYIPTYRGESYGLGSIGVGFRLR